MKALHVLLVSGLMLGGCAGSPSVSENQCAAGDWQTVGYRDGVNGVRASRLLAHQDACGRHGIVPDRAEYMLGWESGVREYCQPSNGFQVGEHGWRHDNVCPQDLQAGFLSAYREGLDLYQARAAVANLEWEIARKTERLAEVKTQIVTTAAAQLDAGLTAADRVELVSRVQRLHEEQQRLKREIPDLEAELLVKSRELDNLNRTLAAR